MLLRRLPALVVLLLCLVALPGLAQKADEKPAKASKLPVDVLVVVSESVEKALEMGTDLVVLTPEAYQKLQEELTRLRQLVERTVQTPTSLHLKGKVDGNLVHLSAHYKFNTDKAGVIVRLGCSPAQATGVSLEGKTPRLFAGRPGKARDDDGFSVQIDKAGEHSLTLDLVLPLVARGNGQGFSLELPRAAITEVELDLPAGSRDIRYAGKPLNGSGVSLKGNRLSGHPVAIDKLELDWKSAQAASAGAVFTADGHVQVRLDKQEMVSKAEIKLSVQSGQVKQYRLIVPLKSEITTDETVKARITRIDSDDKKQVSIRTIHLKEPSADPLKITVTSRTESPRPGGMKTALIGPFNVIGAVRQSGSVLVSNAVSEWHIEPSPRGDTTRRAATEEEFRKDSTLAAVFRYGPGDGGERQAGLAWLELDVENVGGQLSAKVAHALTLVPAENAGIGPDDKPRPNAQCWQTRTTLTVTPRRAGITRFAVAMPPGCDLKENSVVIPERVRSFHYDSARRLLEFRLSTGEADAIAPITVSFDGNYPALDPKAPMQATLVLPRPLRMAEQEGSIRVVASTVELLPPPIDRTVGLELVRQSVHELTYRYPARRAPDRLEVLWRPYRPVVGVESLIDLTLAAGLGRVRHELRFQPPPGGPALTRVSLRVPEGLAGELRIRKGGEISSIVADSASVLLTGAGPPVLELEYSFALAESGQLPVPLVRPEGDFQGETRVRVWSEAGLLPIAPRADWLEQPLEEVPGRERLPVLVLRSAPLDRPLLLNRANHAAASRVLIDRVLVEIAVDHKEQSYTVSYRLSRLAGRHLDFELPAQASAIRFEAKLNGKKIEHEDIAAGKDVVPTVRLRLSSGLVRPGSVLELRYHLTPYQAGASPTPLTTQLLPPRLLGDVSGAPTRWLVDVPADWVLLGPEPGAGSPVVWRWQRWLWRPRPQASVADLKAWFAGADPAADAQADWPSLSLWRDGSQPLRLTHISQQLWMIGCSLLLAIVGLGLSRLVLSPHRGRAVWAWLLGGALLVCLLVLAVLRPVLTAQIAYGCQPGVVVLLVLVLLQWGMHERYRRRVVFLPSFSRARAGSSLSRREVPRPHGEPSTVDVPQAMGSSAERRP